MSDEELLTTAEAAKRMRASVPSLARWRGDGTGPRYIKRRGRILYRESDIRAFEEENERVKTREG